MKKLLPIVIFLFFTYSQAQNIRGAWLTNVDSKVLNSTEGIKSAVKEYKELGLNTIFVVVWNKGFTLYPSKIMKDLIGVKIIPEFAGRDPLRELIDEAHANKLKVIAWFEFGFTSSYMLDGGMIVKLHPNWSSKNNKREMVVKNGFDWLNGFNPEVQNFLLSVIMECVRAYDIDGVQGDDRLPAMPIESGYDSYTINLYKEDHNGALPPDDFRDSTWMQWRADLMTDFMRRIHDSLKTYDKNLIVSMAPSIYPWSKEEYLQDWPVWVEKGYVDQIIPQIYRYDFKDYQKAIDDIVNIQLKSKDRSKFFPGVLLKVGKYTASEDYIKKVIKYNRDKRIDGEVFFFYEGLKDVSKALKRFYK